MGNQQVAIHQSQKPLEGYRGALVYRQEYGYKLITMMIDLRPPDERSRVISRVSNLPLTEEAEHLPSGFPLAAIDLYHFPATDGMQIGLAIRSQVGVHKAYYIVDAASVEERSSFLWLDVVKARASIRECDTQTHDLDHDVKS